MKTFHGRATAFSLVEVTLAIGVAAFCLIAVFGLLPVGVNSNQAAIQQTTAAGLASNIMADLRAPTKLTAGLAVSPIYGINVPSTGSATHVVFLRDDGSAAGAVDKPATATQNPRYRATLVFTVPPAAASYYGTTAALPTQGKAVAARILITWPALADTDNTKPPTQFAGAFEVVTALNR